MAELALVASIIQIADTGYRLSLKLYTTGEAISSADRAIVTISKDISLTSTVLKELGHILGRDEDEKERICSDNLVQTAGDTVKDCLDVFEELDKMILKNMPNLSQGNKATRATMAMERLKWPFIQPRIQLLKGSLDMLRANISLMLNVLIYARHQSDRKKFKAPAPDVYDEASQKTIIEELVNAKEEYVRKFESLKLSVTASPSTQTPDNIGRRAAPAHPEGYSVSTERSFNPVFAPTSQNAFTPQQRLNPSFMSAFPYATAPEHNSDNITATTFKNNPASQHNFNHVSGTTLQDTPAPQHTFNPLSTTAFKGAPASQHTSMPFSATTFQNTPLPQQTFNPSATTLRNTPAPQWPLPDIPTSYPVVSDDPVTVQSGQYNPWELLQDFDNLLNNLVREVYSPGYQIPVDSRSRFTGAIRETHALEAVELQKRNPSMSGIYANELPPVTPYKSPIPEVRAPLNQSTYMSYLRPQAWMSNLHTPGSPAASGYQDHSPGPDPTRFDPRAPGRFGVVRRRHGKANRRWMQNHQILGSEAGIEEEQPATKRTKHDTEEISESEAGIEEERFDSEISPPSNLQAPSMAMQMARPSNLQAPSMAMQMAPPSNLQAPSVTMRKGGAYYGNLRPPPQVPQLQKPDVVDDLLKLWTIVR